MKGAVLITKTTELERMYRGNTPYPKGKIRCRQRVYASRAQALAALGREHARRKGQSYHRVESPSPRWGQSSKTLR